MYDRCLGPDTYVTTDVNNCCQGPVTQVLIRCLGPDKCVKWMWITVAWGRLHIHVRCMGPDVHVDVQSMHNRCLGPITC